MKQKMYLAKKLMQSKIESILTVLPKITPFSTGSDALYPGDYLSLQCSVMHGDLPLSISWKFNDRIIESNNEVGISKSGSRSSVLTIESIRDHHAGNITCVGKNTAGVANYTVALVVNGSNLSPPIFCFVCLFYSFHFFKVYLLFRLSFSLFYFFL